MRHPKTSIWIRILAAALVALKPGAALACAACYGQSDSPLAKGMSWGILSLLVVVVGVLGSIAAFFVYLARRSAALTAEPISSDLVPSTNKA
jgi:hypothetical protein